ncbi:hypothetical protein DFH06DRAFT_518732 [Mycena polygramma]|nr:hypothetical protein DFH06DRAFT_518732 [Mycena polygramma]
MNSFRCHYCGVAQATPPPNPNVKHATPGTRHHVLLNSNEPPLDSDIPIVETVILDAGAWLGFLNKEIERLEERQKELQAERVSLYSYEAQNRIILSPLRRMPPEILEEIFSWTLAPAANAIQHRRYRPTESPWVLTHVSRGWRAAAVSNPSLWSLVAISYQPSPLVSSPSYPLPMIETHISRAYTLKIHFYGCQTSDPNPQIESFKCLAKHALRWEELSLGLTSSLYPLLDGLRGRVPLLRRLAIEWDGEESQQAVDSIDCFESAPSLADLSIANEYRFIPVSVPTWQLTRYELDAPWDIHRSVLKLVKNLVEARIVIDLGDNGWRVPGDNIELLYLRRLYVSDPFVLTFLEFPLLEEITLSLYRKPADGGLPHLESSLMRSLCPIRKLCFYGCPDAHLIPAFLEKFRAIVEFTVITESPVTSARAQMLIDIFEEETAASSPRVVAPQLRRLSFGCLRKGSLDYTRFLEMVKYRWEASSYNLQRAALCVGSGPHPDAAVLDGINTLRKDGLDFVFLEGTDATIEMGDWLSYSRWN